MTITAPSPPIPTPRGTERWGGLFLVVGGAAAGSLVLVGAGNLILHLVAGLFVLVVLPVLLVNAKVNWPRKTTLVEALLYSLAAVILSLMIGGLIINQVLPLLGVPAPLDRVPVAIMTVVGLFGLALWRPSRWRLYDGLPIDGRVKSSSGAGWRDQVVLFCAVVMIAGSLVGPIRLNNGASGAVSAATLILAAIVVVMIFSWRRTLQESTTLVTIYLLSLSLLLITSLRGWFATGHDIQQEFGIFQLVQDQGVWNIAAYQDAYNACLSITIFPTIIERVTGIPELYIFKIVFQLLFALCPILVYLITRRFAPKSVALLAVIYFLPFSVYFTDMPYLNRQELAFFFLGVALLLITSGNFRLTTKRIGFVFLGAGVLLSHYSTMYVLIGVLVFASIIGGTRHIGRMLVAKRRSRIEPRRRDNGGANSPTVVNWIVVVTLTALTYLWVGPVTHTGGEVNSAWRSTVNSLTGNGTEFRSPIASYAFFGFQKPKPETVLKEYREGVIKRTEAGRADNEYYPLAEVDKFPTPVLQPESLPLTSLGRIAEDLGVDVAKVKGQVGGALARIVQLFIGLGFLLVLLRRAGGFTPSTEFVLGAAGCLGMAALNVLLPVVSTRYDIERTMIQTLFWLAPFWAVGGIQAFGWLGRWMSIQLGLGVAVLFFLLSSGVISQAFGIDPPQMHLNNAGTRYDKYYLHEQDVSAVKWLQDHVTGKTNFSLQSEPFTGIFSYSELRPDSGVFPALIRTNSYVFLSEANVKRSAVTVFLDGDQLTYHYPLEFLDANKSLLYCSSDGARVYR